MWQRDFECAHVSVQPAADVSIFTLMFEMPVTSKIRVIKLIEGHVLTLDQ